MLKAVLQRGGAGLTVLLIGAHPDDIEIGCGGAVLQWVRQGIVGRVHWIVLSGAGTERETEARSAAAAFLDGLGASSVRVAVEDFRDGYFPYHGEAVKDYFEGLKDRVTPDLVLTHRREDLHQDHRFTGELTWNTFRDHLILEYEIPKYDGDLGTPNVFVELPQWAVDEKVRLMTSVFGSQLGRPWFTDEMFRALLRLRGVECRSESGFAEGLYARKLKL